MKTKNGKSFSSFAKLSLQKEGVIVYQAIAANEERVVSILGQLGNRRTRVGRL